MNKSRILSKYLFPVIIIIALLIMPAILDSSYYLSIVITIGIFSLFAISYDLLMGYTGIVSFGHAMYFGLGAYIVAYTTVKLDWGFIPALLLVVVCCIIVSYIVGIITIRVKKIYFNMVTMALGQLFYVLSLKLTKITGGDDGLPGVRSIFGNKLIFYYFIIFIVIVVLLVAKRIVNSPTGSVFKAINSNEKRVVMLGYDVFKYKLIILQISGIIAGLAGSLYVTHIGIAYPTLLHSSLTLQALFMVVLGGTGTLNGAIIGAVILRLADSFLSQFTTRWMLILGIIFIIIVLFFPKGMVGVYKQILGKIKNKNKGGE